MARLSRRLRAIARLVPPGSVVADIGTDHAYLPIYLVSTGRSPRAIATDSRPGPLGAARAAVHEAGLEDAVDLRQGDGLEPLAPGEADVLVIAGLGGVSIAKILDGRPPEALRYRRVVAQPMVAGSVLRRWLLEHEFLLEAEDLVEGGQRLYELIAAAPPGAPGAEGLDAAGAAALADRLGVDLETVLEIGPLLLEPPHRHLAAWIQEKQVGYRRILRDMARGSAGRRPAGQESFGFWQGAGPSAGEGEVRVEFERRLADLRALEERVAQGR